MNMVSAPDSYTMLSDIEVSPTKVFFREVTSLEFTTVFSLVNGIFVNLDPDVCVLLFL